MTQTNQILTAAAKSVRSSKRETKRDQLVKLLRRRAGADAPTINAKMGWLPHSTRAALTGLRKAGFELEAMKPETGGPTRYRITNTLAKATA